MSFAFLPPDGISPEKENDQGDWQPVSYTDVLDAIRSARENLALSPEVNLLLDHYTEAVMKHITGDKKVIRISKIFAEKFTLSTKMCWKSFLKISKRRAKRAAAE